MALAIAVLSGGLASGLVRDLSTAWQLDRDGDLDVREKRIEDGRLEVSVAGSWRSMGRVVAGGDSSTGHYRDVVLDEDDADQPPEAARNETRDFLAVLDWTTGLGNVALRFVGLGLSLGILAWILWTLRSRRLAPSSSPPPPDAG